MAEKSNVYEITSFRGGLSDDEDRGIKGAFKFGSNLDIRKRVDSLSAGQALTDEGLDSAHSPSSSVSPSVSVSPSPSPSPSRSISPTPSITPSNSPSLSPSLSPSVTASQSPSPSPSPSPSVALTTIFEDLIHFFVKASDGYTYGFGNRGIIYRRDADGYWQRVYRDITAEESVALNYETGGVSAYHSIGDIGGVEYWSAVRLDVTERINCSSVSIYLSGKIGVPTGDMTFRIETDSGTKPLGKPSGTLVHALATGAIANASLTTSAWNKLTLSTQITLPVGTYWLVVKVPAQLDGVRWHWLRNDTGTGGAAMSIDGGINWESYDGARIPYFRLYESHLVGAIKGAAEKPTTTGKKYLYWMTNTTVKRKLLPGLIKSNEESVLANFETGSDSYHSIGDIGGVEYRVAFKFTTTKTLDFGAVSIYLEGKAGSPTGDMTFRIESDNTGPSGILAHASATGAIANASISQPAWNKLSFASSFALVAGTYWVVVSVPSQSSGVRWHLSRDMTGIGGAAMSTDGGAWEVYANARIPYFRIYKLDLAGFPNWNDVETVASNLEPADWHTIKQVGGALMIANKDKLAMVGYDDSYTNEALDMIPGNIAKTIVERNGRSIIGTGLVSDPTKSINAAIDCEVPLAQVGDDGDIYFANMSDTIPAKRFPGGGKVNPGGVANFVEEINFFEWEQDSLSWIDKKTIGNLSLWGVWGADTGYGGIYSYGRKNKNHPFVLNLDYLLDVDEIGAITTVDGATLASYKDGTEYGVKVVDTTTKATGIYEGLDFKAPVKQPINITEWKYAELFMSPLPSGASVSFYYKVNKTGSWVQAKLADGTTSYSVANGKKAVFNIAAEGEIFEPKIVLIPFGNLSPEIHRVRIYFS